VLHEPGWDHEIWKQLVSSIQEGNGDVLDKAISSAATLFFLLQLNKLKLAERFKYIL